MKEERREPDCRNCIRKDSCGNAEEGHFCAMFQSREPEKEGEDPNSLWKRGEEAVF